METMKKKWGNPEIEVQEFTAQYCVSPCTNKEGDMITWKAKCRGSQCLIFYGYEVPADWKWDASRGGCGREHEFTTPADQTIGPNCWLLVRYNSSNIGSSPSEWWTDSDNRTTLKSELVEYLKGAGELLPGYYNDSVLGSHFGFHNWLVTEDLANIKISS